MKFTIRPWTLDDLDSLVNHANNWNVAKNMTDKFPFPYTDFDGREFIEWANQDSILHIFAIDIEGKAVGGIGIHPQDDIHRKNAELGYWLAEPYWGKGIMPKAVSHMIAFSFEAYDIDRIFARPFATNKASQRVLEKTGFILEGRFEKAIYKNGEYIDELIYAVRRKSRKEDI